MPRTKAFVEEEALLKALNLFWSKGYEATSLSDLTTHLGIGKGSFYDTFGSKKELFDRAFAVYRIKAYEKLKADLAAKENRVEGIKNYIENHTAIMLDGDKRKGCFVANSTAELANDETVRTFLQEHNAIMKSGIVDYLKAGNISGAEAIADAVLTYTMGISLLSKIIDKPKRLKAANAVFMRSIEGMVL